MGEMGQWRRRGRKRRRERGAVGGKQPKKQKGSNIEKADERAGRTPKKGAENGETTRIPKPSCQRRWVRGKWPKYHDERERGKKFTPRKTGQRSKRRERRPEANEEGNETRELGNKEKGTRGTEGRSDKEKEGRGRTRTKIQPKISIWFKKEGVRSKKTPLGERTGVG